MNHLRVATIDLPDPAAVAAALPGCTGLADLVEVRLDALWSDVPPEDAAVDALVAILGAAEAAGVRLLATLRPARQGGRYGGSEESRVSLLVAAARAGFSAVDLEDDHPGVAAVRRLLGQEGVDVVLSDHRFHAAPDRETGLRHLQSMQDLGGRLDKLAYPAGALPDLLRGLELVHAHGHRNGHPAVTPYGHGDAATRALLAVAGNQGTYGHAPDAPPAVPGQPALADVQATWDRWGIVPDDLGARPEGSPWLAVLGDPVAHSLSPRIHNAALRHADRPERFGALRLPDSLPTMRLVVTVAPRVGLRGASVTTPLKHHAALVSDGDATVRATGAANCIRVRGTTVESTNTDATAAARLLRDRLEPGARVAVLGSGPAARACIHGARAAGMAVVVASRRPDADVLGAEHVPWGEREGLRADAWVQATRLGMDPGDVPALSADALHGAALAVELVYAHGPTPFQAAAEAAGVPTVDGRGFLLEQAVDAYRYWTGQDPDRTAMEAALA